MICSSYHDDINFIRERGVCYATKEKEPCRCRGNTLKCDFYPVADSEKFSFLIGELRTLYLNLARSIDAIEELEKCSISKDSFVSLSTGIKEGYKEVWYYIGCILKEIE